MTLIVLLLVFLLGRHYGVRTTIPKPPPFLVDSSKLPPPNEPAPASLNLVKDQKIPPIVHYVFGMSKDFGGKPFSFVQFVAINSALTNIKPERVIFWYRHMPQSWWFDKVQEYAKKHGVVWENKLAREVDEILWVFRGTSRARASCERADIWALTRTIAAAIPWSTLLTRRT